MQNVRFLLQDNISRALLIDLFEDASIEMLGAIGEDFWQTPVAKYGGMYLDKSSRQLKVDNFAKYMVITRRWDGKDLPKSTNNS
jgi:hypothetical protein